MGSIVLLDLMGGVALLLWGLHMVLTGVLRAFGPHLRRFLGKALGNRFSAFGAGLGMTRRAGRPDCSAESSVP
jgi:phosphate:Na+ symporter